MDRTFDKGEIKYICNELKKILKDCRREMKSMAKEAQKAKNAMDSVPDYAKESRVIVEADALLRAIDDVDFDTIFKKLDDCRNRACSLIPSADKNYAKETAEIRREVENITKAARRIQEFLIDTPLNTDPKAFAKSLQVASMEWNEVMDGTETLLDKILKRIKGVDGVCSIFSPDPVNLSTGNFIYHKTDLEIGGNNPFLFRRFYNAMNDRSGVLGRDWNHNYEVSVETDGDERILILEEGKEERFVKTADGVYTGVYQDTLLLEETKEGYVYQTKEEKTYHFDQQGSLIQKVLGDGSRILLAHEGGHLVSVRKESGESFALSYTEDGYLESVTDHTGRCVSYRMSGDCLVGVSTPKGHWNHYEYSPEGKLEGIRNAWDMVVVENTYDEKLRTTVQKFPDGGQMSFAYRDEAGEVILTERNGSTVTYVHDDRYRDIRHIYPDGDEKFAYNKWNQKTMETDKLGNRTQYGYDEKGNLTRIINALGEQTGIRYGEHGKPVTVSINGEVQTKNTYDEKGNLIRTEDAMGNSHEIRYNDRNRPEEVMQPDGSRLTLSYDGRGNITSLTDASGVETSYAYDALNRVIRSVDGNGNETLYAYDEEDNLTAITNAEGKERSYSYNETGKVTCVTDFDGSIVRREYNTLNLPSKVTDALGRETKLTYDSMWNLARVTQPDGAKTTYLYNEYNRLGRIRNANGDVIRYTYDANGNRIKETDEEGNETCFSYDALNRLVSVYGTEGVQISYAYDASGNLAGLTDALGNQVAFRYDACGNLTRETGPCGEERIYTYTKLGQMESMTDEAGRKTEYVYAQGGRLTEIRYPDGNKQSYTYDRGGRIQQNTAPTGYQVNYAYDSLDRIIKVTGSCGEERGYRYDSAGNVISMTDALGYETKYEYSLTGQLTKVTDALGNETCYLYDVCDRLKEIRQYGEETQQDLLEQEFQKVVQANAAGRICHVTTYERDPMGRVTVITDAAGEAQRYGYNRRGELIEKVDKEGYLTRYAYTAQGDVAHVQYADGREVRLSYNPLRHLQQIEDWLGITRIETDPVGRALKVTYPDKREAGYAYGPSGERRSVTYPDGKRVEYGYDGLLRLSSVKDGEDMASYRYDKTGFLKEKTLPNGAGTLYDYDTRGQLTGFTNTDREGVLDAYTYEYDLNGSRIGARKERRSLPEESGTCRYEYDPVGRLSGVSRDGQEVRRYTYDAFGNRTQMREGMQVTSCRYNELNQLIHAKGIEMESTYHYDKRGNLAEVHKDGRIMNRYHFGALNRLEGAVNHETGQAARYAYNGLGHRVGRTAGNMAEPILPDVDFEKLVMDPSEHVADVIDITRQYHNLLERQTGDEKITYLWGDGVLGATGTEGSTYYLQDDLGSPLRLLDKTGMELESYGYDEFGSSLYETKGLQLFTYTGYQRDEVADTYYAQAREYRPEMGRFMSEDRIKGRTDLPDTMNPYLYCRNMPFLFVDLNGLDWIFAWEGTEAHKVLQYTLETLYAPNVKREYPIPGAGRADLVYMKDGMAEVYEIKPKSYKPGGINYEAGKAQLQRYIDGLDVIGQDAKPGKSLDSMINAVVLPSFIHPNKLIKYSTYPQAPGMIYWEYIDRKKEPQVDTVPEMAFEPKADKEVIAVILTVALIVALVGITIASGGGAAPLTVPITAMLLLMMLFDKDILYKECEAMA